MTLLRKGLGIRLRIGPDGQTKKRVARLREGREREKERKIERGER
jgi:hypothetical protein